MYAGNYMKSRIIRNIHTYKYKYKYMYTDTHTHRRLQQHTNKAQTMAAWRNKAIALLSCSMTNAAVPCQKCRPHEQGIGAGDM
jgi:hypothetical protein